MAMRATVCQAMRHHNHITSHIQPTHTLTQISTEHLTMYTFTVYIWIWILHNQNEYIFFFVQHTTCNEFVFFFCFLHIKEITVLYEQICKMFIFHWSFSIECRWKLVWTQWRNGENTYLLWVGVISLCCTERNFSKINSSDCFWFLFYFWKNFRRNMQCGRIKLWYLGSMSVIEEGWLPKTSCSPAGNSESCSTTTYLISMHSQLSVAFPKCMYAEQSTALEKPKV